MSVDPTLKAFSLMEPIARGGMGEVWAAQHIPTKTEVAIKVLHTEGQRKAVAEAFSREARAVSALHHPGVVPVYEFGRCGVDDPFEEGRPWLAMELCRGGSLVQQDLADWPSLRQLIVRLLEVLAHSHARGVLHRDIKPENVLFDRPRDFAAARLADFGLATVLGAAEEPSDRRIVGTPAYMAPEQFLQRWRAFCPATDLYGLAGMVWAIVSGSAPFARFSKDIASLARAHLSNAPPPLDPVFALPMAMEEWLLWLLEKDPAARPASAADALLNLPQIDAPVFQPNDEITREFEADTLDLTDTLDDVLRGPKRLKPSLAEKWRIIPPPPAALADTGLGMFALRNPPFVGRDGACDVLWSALRASVEGGRMIAAHLSAAAGSGKSRVIRELRVQAHETAGMPAMHARHSANGSAVDGLEAMLINYFGANGLEGDALRRHLRQQRSLQRDLGLGARVFEWLKPSSEARRNPSRWLACLYSIIKSIAADRGLILVLEDLQWGSDALYFCEFVMRRQDIDPAPIFLVTSERSHATMDSTARADRLARWRERPGVLNVALNPMANTAIATLVEAMLGVSEALKLQVVGRSDGHPLFTIQLLQAWVDRGWLLPGPTGLELEERTGFDIPDSLHQLWLAKLLPLIDSLDGIGRLALEGLAYLGREFTRDESEALFLALSYPDGGRLIERMLNGGLMTLEGRSQAWMHGLLQEAMVRHASEEGEPTTVHRAVSAALRVVHGDSPEHAGRIARHLIAGGDAAGGLNRLRMEASYHLKEGRLVLADDAVRLAIDVLDTLSPEEHGSLRVAFDMLAAQLLIARNHPRRALELVEPIVDSTDDEAHRCAALLLAGQALEHLCKNELAAATLDKAISLADRFNNQYVSHSARRQRAWTAMRSGDFAIALRRLGEAHALLKYAGEHVESASILRDQAVLAKSMGRYDVALNFAAEAEAAARLAKSDRVLVASLETRAEVLRLTGRIAEAAALYRRALVFQRERGWTSHITELNLGMTVAAQGGDPAQAEALFGLKAAFEERERSVPALLAGLAAELALLDRKPAQESAAALDDLYGQIADGDLVDPDIAWLFERIAMASSGPLASRFAARARALWQRLGVDERPKA